MAASPCPPDPRRPLRKPNRLLKRRDFLAAAQAFSWTTPGFVLQARRRPEGHPAAHDAWRYGLTASKKVGQAVVRNRARRRLRALAESDLPDVARPGWDYVLIARAETTAKRGYAAMRADLASAVAAVHEGRQSGRRPPRRRKRGGD